MMLSVEVLGQLRIFSDRKEVTKPRKARALLAVLAVMAARGHTVTRANLAGLLWPYQSGEPGRHSLRNCLMELCKALGPDSDLVLYRDNNVCRLLVPSDVERFEQLAGSEDLDDLKEAARLYRGDLLEGFELDLDTWDEWLDLERDRLRRLASRIFSKLATSAAVAGDHDGAIAAARRLVDLDELNEASQRGLITALEAAGRRSEAVRQYSAASGYCGAISGCSRSRKRKVWAPGCCRQVRAQRRTRVGIRKGMCSPSSDYCSASWRIRRPAILR
jgi:DNA-binding SARP family transcriptional activator